MTKADLIERVCERVGGFSKKEAAEVVESLFEIIKSTLERGEPVKVSGFGKFTVRDKAPRPGCNPQTKEVIMIEAKRVVLFKPSNLLRKAMNRDLRAREGEELLRRAAEAGIVLPGSGVGTGEGAGGAS